jgi:hypothetical protein
MTVAARRAARAALRRPSAILHRLGKEPSMDDRA